MRLPLGVAGPDAALGGGLRLGALHEVAAGPGEEGALCAFAFGLAVRAAAGRGGPVLLAQQDLAQWEAGRLYGPGLEALGLPAEALLLVRVRTPQDVLFVMEEGLKCTAIAAVLGQLPAALPGGLTATRRLSLAAREGGGLGLLLRHKADDAPCAAQTRWRIAPLPSPAPDGLGGLGPPRLLARLVRNRCGPVGAWPLAWGGGIFRPAPEGGPTHEPARPLRHGPALSQPRFAPSGDGSDRAVDVA